MISEQTHIRCLNCGTVWVRADNPDILQDYMGHQPCRSSIINSRSVHPSNWEPR